MSGAIHVFPPLIAVDRLAPPPRCPRRSQSPGHRPREQSAAPHPGTPRCAPSGLGGCCSLASVFHWARAVIGRSSAGPRAPPDEGGGRAAGPGAAPAVGAPQRVREGQPPRGRRLPGCAVGEGGSAAGGGGALHGGTEGLLPPPRQSTGWSFVLVCGSVSDSRTERSGNESNPRSEAAAGRWLIVISARRQPSSIHIAVSPLHRVAGGAAGGGVPGGAPGRRLRPHRPLRRLNRRLPQGPPRRPFAPLQEGGGQQY